MHPYIQYQLAGTRVADMRTRAERHQTVQAARRAPQPHFPQAVNGSRATLARVLSALLTTYRQRRRPGTVAAQAH